MEERHKDLLRRNRLALVRGMITDQDMLSFLMATKTLTDAMADEIQVKLTKRDKNGALLDLLPRRGPHAFRIFVEGLVETEQGGLADLLDANIANNYRAQHGLEAEHYPGSIPTQPPPNPAQRPIAAPSEVPAAEVLPLDTIFPNVNMIKTADPQMIAKVTQNQTDCYKIGRRVRGRCIILNIDKFSKESKKKDREGSYTDVTNLTQVFTKLNFDVHLWDNLTREQILKNISDERKNKAHKESEAFVMAILSHGKEDAVFGIDGGEVRITDEIVQQFNGLKCEGLIDKPKVFFIQACQGSGETKGVVPDDAGDALPEADQKLPSEPTHVHEWADILVVTGTVPGYKAWRNVIQGSWFITDLTVALVQYAHFKHLEDIITIVTRKVSDRARDNTGHKQICQKKGQFRRDLYLLPGYVEECA